MKTSQNIFLFLLAIGIISLFLFLVSYLIAYFCNNKFFTKWKIFFINFFFILLFAIGLSSGENFPESITSFCYSVGAIVLWINFLTFLVLFPFFLIAKIRNKDFSKFTKIIIAIFCISINFYGLFMGFVPEVKNFSIQINKNHSMHGKKFVIISDMHYGYIHGKMEAQFLVDTVNNLNPDFVLIPGDVFDGPKINFEEITNILAQISAPTFYVNGNREEYRHTSEILDAITKTDIIILNDETKIFDDLIISGVRYHKNKTNVQLTQTLSQIQENDDKKIKILLKHEPTGHSVIEKFWYDLIVSGHTHRGQMWPISLIPEKIYGKYVYGLHKDETLFSLTTSGVGNWGPPQRLGSRSEIIVLEIE